MQIEETIAVLTNALELAELLLVTPLDRRQSTISCDRLTMIFQSQTKRHL